jgi:hypothetical protein
MNGGNMGIAGVQYQRDPHGLEASPGQLGTMGAGRGRQAGAHDMGEVHPPALEKSPFFHERTQSSPALRPSPGIPSERMAIGSFQSHDDAFLQIHQVSFQPLGIERRMG